jgi:hypothetical protein
MGMTFNLLPELLSNMSLTSWALLVHMRVSLLKVKIAAERTGRSSRSSYPTSLSQRRRSCGA